MIKHSFKMTSITHLDCLLDTGSWASIIGAHLIPSGTKRHRCRIKYGTSSGATAMFTEYVWATYRDVNDDLREIQLFVSEGLDRVILGFTDIGHFGYALQRILPYQRTVEKSRLYAQPYHVQKDEFIQDVARLAEFQEQLYQLFKDNEGVSGRCAHPHAEFKLDFKPGTDITQIAARSHIPPHARKEFDDHIQDWIDKKFVSKMPPNHYGVEIGWIVSLHPKFRPCVNSVYINPHVVITPTPFQSVDELYDRLKVIKIGYMSQLDLKSAYLSVNWKQNPTQTVYFNWKNERYTFNRMPFGFSSSPFKFTSLMHDIFGHLEWLFVYFDNLLIVGG